MPCHANTKPRTPLTRLFTAALAMALLAGTPLAARAENHALIMWIGDYGSPTMNLPGIDKDAQLARQIALSMGVPERNIREVSNQALTKNSLGKAISDLAASIKQDDKVFIYYSGHGAQVRGVDGAKCTEGVVTRDPALFEDFRLQSALKEIGSKASQVVMMNDSCFSGGAASKSLGNANEDLKPKFWPADQISTSSMVSDEHICGEAVNKMTRNLQAVANTQRAPQVLYIAASAANEVSYATSRGSVGTVSWASCLGKADTNRSGAIDGEELRACAQRFINSNGGRQTITVMGNSRLPLLFSTTSSSSSIDPLRTLEDIRASRDTNQRITLSPAKGRMRIGQDTLDFTINSSASGYLYVLHVGSDGKTFDLLFPNKQDSNNYINAGSHSFPRPSWRIRAGGPAGRSALLAVVSPVQKQIGGNMDASGLFPSATVDADGAKTLIVEATGTAGGSGRIAASDVITIDEVN